MIFKGTMADCVNLATAGIKQQMEADIKKRLLAMVMPEIEAVARETARDITSKIQSYHNIRDDRIELVVNFTQNVVKQVGP